MGDLMGGMFSNDSLFGRIMTRLGIIIAANILFVLCTVPVVTAGAGLAALHYTMLKMLRKNGHINPFKTFWEGLKMNAKQATIVWLVYLALSILLYLEWFWCGQFGGFFLRFRLALPVIGFVAAALGLFLFPTMAAFKATLGDLVKDSIFFAFRKPLHLIVILFFSLFPMMLTYTDNQFMPLYGFLWITCGFSLVCLLTDTLLLRQFEPYLPKINEFGEFISEDENDTPLIRREQT